eukprot:SAG11_NODE_148_length_14747_cov_217.933517_16_plen_71_part_00
MTKIKEKKFFAELLEHTDLDEKASAAIKMAEIYVENRKNNLLYVVLKFPIASAIIALISATVGFVAGYIV